MDNQFSSTAGYLLVNMWKVYEADTGAFGSQPHWEGEMEFMCYLAGACQQLEETITEMVDFDDNDGVFDYEVIDDAFQFEHVEGYTNPVILAHWAQVFVSDVQLGLVTKRTLQDNVKQMMEGNPNDLRLKEQVPNPDNAPGKSAPSLLSPISRTQLGHTTEAVCNLLALNPAEGREVEESLVATAEKLLAKRATAERDHKIKEAINTLEGFGLKVSVWEEGYGAA